MPEWVICAATLRQLVVVPGVRCCVERSWGLLAAGRGPGWWGMPEYVLDHHQEGERERLALMSRLLDPMHRGQIERLGVGSGARTLEVGCGNGSVSAWLAGRIAPGGRAVAVDLDLSLAIADVPGLELRQADILAGPVEPGDFDLVTARAVLHHVADAEAAVVNLVASARPGAAVLLIEPDFLPATVAEPPEVRAFWKGWLAWSRGQGIDYFIGRRLPAMLSRLGLQDVEATAQTAHYNGGSGWAVYWRQTVIELRARLVASGKLDDRLIDTFLARCADPAWWTQTIAFTAAAGRVRGE
jgi:SAM-dependent methyltransferase